MAGENKTAVILLWTFAREPAFFRQFEATYDQWWVIPLRYQAYHEARSVLSADHLMTASQVVPCHVRSELFAEAERRLDRLWHEVNRFPHEPWLQGLQFYMLQSYLYSFLYWHAFLQRLPGGEARDIFHYGPFSRRILSGNQLVDVDILDALTGGGADRSSWRDRLYGRIGQWVVRRPNRWTRGSSHRAPSPARVVVCGLQSTDWLAQKPLVPQLMASGCRNLRWMKPAADRLVKTADEEAVGESSVNLMAYTDCYNLNATGQYCDATWRHPRVGSLIAYQIRRRFRQVLSETFPEREYVRGVQVLSRILAAMHPDLVLNYLSIERLLNAYDPQVVIANSVIDQISVVRAWCRRKQRQFVRLAHGVEINLDGDYLWDTDVAGAIGPYARDRIQDNPSIHPVVLPVGAMHLDAQGHMAARQCEAQRSGAAGWPKRLLFVLKGYMGYDFPDALDEVLHDLQSMAEAIAPTGWELAIRCHPRHVDREAFSSMIASLQESGYPVSESDPKESLASDLARSGAVLTRSWSGPAVVGLYSGTPVIGWLARTMHRHLEQMVHDLPLQAVDGPGLAAILDSLHRDPSQTRSILERQREILEAYHFVTEGDPYALAADALGSVLRNDFVNRAHPKEHLQS